MMFSFSKIFKTASFYIIHTKYIPLLLWREKTIVHKHYKYDQSVMVVRKYNRGMGLLSCYLSYLGHFKHCEETGMTPIVDMLTHYYPLVHKDKQEKDKMNAWEYYFNRVSDVNLKALNKYKSVFYVRGTTPEYSEMFFNGDIEITKETLDEWYAIDKKYVVINGYLLNRFQRTYDELLSGRRVIGTMIREGYICIANNDGKYKNVSIADHPKQPGLDELCDSLEIKMKEWGCDFVFVSAETELVVNYLKKRFNDKVLFSNRLRRKISGFNIGEFASARKDLLIGNRTSVSVNNDYLEEIYLLSKCTCLFSSKCSGSIVAAIWNRGQYEHMYIVNKGVY